MSYEPSRMAKLYDLITDQFNLDELNELCLYIAVEFEDLKGGTRAEKARELVRFCYRRNLTEALISICKKLRPDAAWDTLEDQDMAGGYGPDNQPLVQTPRIGKIPRRVGAAEIDDFISQMPGWTLIEIEEPSVPEGVRQELYRLYEFPSYSLAFSFMTEVSNRAVERYKHHPRWQNAYVRVEVWLTTFNIGYKPSYKDLRLARFFEMIYEEFQRELF